MDKDSRPTTEDRLRALEGKAQTLETWLKVTFGIAAFLGVGGGYFFQRASDLKKNYDDLALKQTQLSTQVGSLDENLRTKAQAILQKEAPVALKAEIAQYVRYGDTVYMRAATRGQARVGLDDGLGTVNTGNGKRGKGQDEGFIFDK